MFLATACLKDDFGVEFRPDGAPVTMHLEFRPMEKVGLGTKAKGNKIDDISDLLILVYDNNKEIIEDYCERLDLTKLTVDKSQTGGDDHDPIASVSFTKSLPNGEYYIIAIANYPTLNYVNNTDINSVDKLKEYSFPTWENPEGNTFLNTYMSGWFKKNNLHDTTEKVETDLLPISVNNQTSNLHCWLRRAASKVTVSFNPHALNESIWIYIHSVTIKDIPKSCTIFNANKPTDISDLQSTGESISYLPNGTDPETATKQGLLLTKSGIQLTNGEKEKISAADMAESVHARDAESLFFYENMQDKGKLKYQVMPDAPDQTVPTFPDGVNPDNENWKDAKPYGTYIEVKGYYESNKEGNEGRGPITYRFMLGKDTETDYNAERNYHYKLNLNFVGNANDVDWHIEYDEIPEIYVTDPFYVSYLYDQVMYYPVKITGEIESDYIDIEIISSNWKPYDETKECYVVPDDEFTYFQGNAFEGYNYRNEPDYDNNDAPWNGFLSLYDTRIRTSIFKNNGSDGFGIGWNKMDWYKQPWSRSGESDKSTDPDNIISYYGCDAEEYNDVNSNTIRSFKKQTIEIYDTAPKKIDTKTVNEVTKCEGYRRYWVPKENGTYTLNTYSYSGTTQPGEHINGTYILNGKDEPVYGSYKVVKSDNVTTFYIPLYTRPLILTTWTSYTGNNPFYSYMRKAEIQIRAKFANGWRTDRHQVLQVRRQINPKVVLRRHDSTKEFYVELMHRTGEHRNDQFTPFPSRGEWSATIITGEGWGLSKEKYGVYSNTVSGSTGDNVSFYVKPLNAISPHQNKCAIVDVEYHNHSCHHKIILRQGYAPIKLEANSTDNVWWHSFNVWWNGRETDDPIEDGSLFKYGNPDQAIDPINNNYLDFQWGGKYYEENGILFRDDIDNNNNNNKPTNATPYGQFWLSPINDNIRATWGNITAKNQAWQSMTLEYPSDTYEVATLEDWKRFVGNPDIELGYGLAYSDGASGIQIESENAFRHSYIAKMPIDYLDDYLLDKLQEPLAGTDLKGAFGTRVCVVYNVNTGNCLALPLGHSGYGHRRNASNSAGNTKGYKGPGSLRYAGASVPIDDAAKRPYLHTLYSNYGAIYWIQQVTGTKDTSWDINYSTFDFNSYETNATGAITNNPPSSDAAYLRLIQRKAPTAKKPGWDVNGDAKKKNDGYTPK